MNKIIVAFFVSSIIVAYTVAAQSRPINPVLIFQDDNEIDIAFEINGSCGLTPCSSCDARFLRLDASNDPITGDLVIDDELTVNSQAAADIPITVNMDASQTGDPFQVQESDGSGCWEIRQNAQVITNAGNGCGRATSTGNYYRVIARPGCTGNYFLGEGSSGIDVIKLQCDGKIEWGNPTMSILGTSGVIRIENEAGSGGVTMTFTNAAGNGVNFIGIDDGSFDSLDIISGAAKDLTVFEKAGSGETPSVVQCGFRAGDAHRCMNITVGGSANDQADFEGVGTYYFDSNMDVEGNFTGNQFYGEMWNYSANATAWTFPIPASTVYYNLTNLTASDLNGFTFTYEDQTQGGSYLTAGVSGLYKVDFSMSFEAAGPGLFGIAIVHDFDVNTHRNCYARRTVSSGNDVGNIGITCLMDVNQGDDINIQIEDEAAPARDIMVHAVNLNLMRVGD